MAQTTCLLSFGPEACTVAWAFFSVGGCSLYHKQVVKQKKKLLTCKFQGSRRRVSSPLFGVPDIVKNHEPPPPRVCKRGRRWWCVVKQKRGSRHDVSRAPVLVIARFVVRRCYCRCRCWQLWRSGGGGGGGDVVVYWWHGGGDDDDVVVVVTWLWYWWHGGDRRCVLTH